MNITDIINKSGMSREEICQKSGVSRSMLSFMENGKRQIGPDRAAILADVPPEQRREALEDLFWSVLTSREFLFNH